MFFQSQSLLMNKVIKNKRGFKLVTSRSSGYKTGSEKFLLSHPVWWYNLKQFSSYSKNYICKFMQANLWHYKLFHFRLSFWIWKVWKRMKKNSKIWISWEQEELFGWNKNTFHSFWWATIWWKNKNLIKSSRHEL